MAQIILDSSNNLIQGDFDNATVNNRTKFKTTTLNGTTNVYAVPNGSSTSAGYSVSNAADPTNASKLTIATNGATDTQIISGINGTGSYLPLNFYTNNALSMTIDTANNVGIGVASPNNKLTVSVANGGGMNIDVPNVSNNTAKYAFTVASGTEIANIKVNAGTGSGSHLTFANYTGAGLTECMRIDSSGNLLVGTTTAFVALSANLQGSGSLGQLGLRNSGATAGKYWQFGPNASNNIICYNNSSVGVYIVDGGTSWTGTSDERLKTDLKPIENAAEKVSTLRAVTGRFIADKENKSRAFLIAQDVQKVLPEAVDASDPEKLGIAYTDVIPLLVAAIKEQQTIINELKTRIEALESK